MTAANFSTFSEGDMAPDFSLEDQDGKKHSLSDYRGKYVVLYFYPKDNTPGCTLEANAFTRLREDFAGENAEVFGISKDSKDSHCKFRDKHGLAITLLADPEKEVLEKYGAWQLKKNFGKESMGTVRSTVLIDPEGKIRKHWQKVKANGHAEKVLAALKELQ